MFFSGSFHFTFHSRFASIRMSFNLTLYYIFLFETIYCVHAIKRTRATCLRANVLSLSYSPTHFLSLNFLTTTWQCPDKVLEMSL